MDRQPSLARRFFDRLEPVHAVTYFAPEARAALDGLGYKGFWMGYFAARSAPLGEVAPDVVTAAFYNFAPQRVAKALPAAWEVAAPADALRVRLESAVAALERYGVGQGDELATAADLLAKAARNAPLDGRCLFAANAALPWPDEPLSKLWHATTLLREQRGDGHIALLISHGISGRESNILHAAAGRVPKEMIMRSRDYDDEQWALYRDRLAERGLIDGDELTDAGRDLKLQIEDGTDRLALPVLDALSDDEVETLFRTLTPITRKVVAGGDVPAATPMGLNREDLDDDSAHLA
ncbi:SCO6745 family protein [Mycobacterium neumannii]|uniref:SCO6745 family protein n=1 Tax=Mycobacterium neumannii TaxID=2048551 RepID=UPI003AB5C440